MARHRSPLTILYVGDLPPYRAGTAITCAQILSGLARRGHAVRALAPISSEALESGDRLAADHPELGVARFRVPALDRLPSHIRPTGDFWSAERNGIRAGFRALVREARPDVVVIGKERYLWYVPEIAAEHRLPSILIVQSTTTAGIVEHSLDQASGERLLVEYRRVDHMVLVAGHLSRLVRRLGFRNYTVIPNGVDLRQFSPRPKDAALLRRLRLRQDQVVVLHASSLREVKRPLDIVRSAERVLQRCRDVAFVVLGDGPCRATMEEHCRRAQILESFRFVGWIDHEKVPDFLSLADIVVMPSEDEALALAYLEAQACGRALIASDIAGAREVIDDGQTGLLFRVGDIDDMTTTMLHAVEDARLRAAIGRRARASVQAHDLDATVVAYENLLRGRRLGPCGDLDGVSS